jgi:hypothetical protein
VIAVVTKEVFDAQRLEINIADLERLFENAIRDAKEVFNDYERLLDGLKELEGVSPIINDKLINSIGISQRLFNNQRLRLEGILKKKIAPLYDDAKKTATLLLENYQKKRHEQEEKDCNVRESLRDENYFKKKREELEK